MIAYDGVELRRDGRGMMHHADHGSEVELGARARGRTLVGGLGMGYTTREAERHADEVITVEISPEVLALFPQASRVVIADVYDVLEKMGRFDAILLDVDHGPEDLILPGNARLYAPEGQARVRAALNSGGEVYVWTRKGIRSMLAPFSEGGSNG